jgi:Na+:H+ antiporter, NhaA family
VLVIALFYSSGLVWGMLGLAAAFMVLLYGLNRARVYNPLPYALLGIGLWLAFLKSGAHPTLAGVLLAMVIPTRPPPNTSALLGQCVAILDQIDGAGEEDHATVESRQQAAAEALESVADRMQSPAQRLEHQLHPWTTFLVLPLFALANAGVRIEGGIDSLLHPVSLGIIGGLVLGKPLGITLFAWVAVRLGVARMPADVSWRQLFGAAWLAGIGFTISLFIAGAAFTDPALVTTAKLSILVASVLAAVVGWTLVWLFSPHFDETTHARPTAVSAPAGR